MVEKPLSKGLDMIRLYRLERARTAFVAGPCCVLRFGPTCFSPVTWSIHGEKERHATRSPEGEPIGRETGGVGESKPGKTLVLP